MTTKKMEQISMKAELYSHMETGEWEKWQQQKKKQQTLHVHYGLISSQKNKLKQTCP